ncbi:MAG: S8 family peptidase [Gemmatimonadaceae bacterium]|nr:S8 family peptidase [Gemmatimonadaceae bacterium]
MPSRSAAARLSTLFAAFLLSACAGSAASTATTAPRPEAAAPIAADVPSFAGETPPDSWHLLDLEADGVAGISANRAVRELLANRRPSREIVVAIIDGGVDTAHAALAPALWRNARETARNARDDDRNGYTDDINGWNFIGGADGQNVHRDTYEAVRVDVSCRRRAAAGSASALSSAERAECTRAAEYVQKERQEMTQYQRTVQQADQVLTMAVGALKTALGTDSLTDAAVAGLQPATPEVARARSIYQQLAAQGITPEVIKKAKNDVSSRLNFGLDSAFNPRPIVGDDTLNLTERGYGNPDVTGPDASHGTHVAGIVAARRSGEHAAGVSPARLMVIRAVPDGDERDKDIANAIRYAVDNGAQIINMSFGKSFSPHKAVVDAAVRYADEKGVLMVHAAGNDGANNDSSTNYPSPEYVGGGRPNLWIEVGASSWKGGNALAAAFSNYGSRTVDLFAPGVAILSTVPGGTYERNDGTSMAAPVVSGTAALLMAYCSQLSAREVKEILLTSAIRRPNQRVTEPGGEREVAFGSLSTTGGIVNAYAAVRLAQQRGRCP